MTSFVVYAVEVVNNNNGTRESHYEHFFTNANSFEYGSSMVFHVTTVDNEALAEIIMHELNDGNDAIIESIDALVDMEASTEDVISLYGRNRYLQDILSKYRVGITIVGNTPNEILRQARA